MLVRLVVPLLGLLPSILMMTASLAFIGHLSGKIGMSGHISGEI